MLMGDVELGSPVLTVGRLSQVLKNVPNEVPVRIQADGWLEFPVRTAFVYTAVDGWKLVLDMGEEI